MSNSNQIKEMVRQKYSEIALQARESNQASCCGAGGCSTDVYNIMTDDYSQVEGYHSDADLGLGCGLPTQFAGIKKGNTVVDLGSGAGNDCFIARKEVGEDGRVIGIDFTPAMIEKARNNAATLGYSNVEFRQGDIEEIPLSNNLADVVVSNCVLNLAPNKERVFAEIYRILKPGGHFSISDIVLVGQLPDELLTAAEMYAGCVAGALQKESYLSLIEQAGFSAITIQKEKLIDLPTDILKQYLSEPQIQAFKNSGTGIYSVTVFAQKPKSCGCATDCCS